MAVDCKKCSFYKITWDKNFPYACGAFGFKSRVQPSAEVLKAAGKECNKFVEKISPKK